MGITPGPWMVVDQNENGDVYITGTNGRGWVAIVTDGVLTMPVAENANLIAAAPELLEAAMLADDALGREYSASDEDTRGGMALKALRDAIKKAKGEQE